MMKPPAPPVCGRVYDDQVCEGVGEHFCLPRSHHAQAFFEEVLVHTKGTFSRKQFRLAPWQRDDLVWPIFGWVRWSDEWDCYVRQYRIIWIELARKNGKSEVLAGIALYLLVADDEEGAEIYGAAKTEIRRARYSTSPLVWCSCPQFCRNVSRSSRMRNGSST